MIVRHLRVERFRGIRSLTWSVRDAFVALVGACDSTKSTILDAIELALSPRWNPPIDDADFHECDTRSPFIIEVTVGRIPERLVRSDKFGMELRGWSPAGGLVDEPSATDEMVLTIRLQVDASLEPKWTVVNERHPEGRPIGAADREMLGLARIGSTVERHLSWSRGAVLARLTEAPDRLARVLAEAGRAARANISAKPLPRMEETARRAGDIGMRYGVAARTKFLPALDVAASAISGGGIALHDGPIPMRRAGLGTRRLLATALQLEAATHGGITLIDEFEHGLEPHRIRGLLRAVRPRTPPKRETDDRTGQARTAAETNAGQVILTTHSPIVAHELGPCAVKVVRNESGVTMVRDVPADLRPMILKKADALLGRKILVCEGKTELGFARAFDQAWSDTGTFLALHGVALLDGEGSAAATTARDFRSLGYDVAFLVDSDAATTPTTAELQAAGVHVVSWAGGVSIEQRIAADLPWDGVAAFVELARAHHGDIVVGAVGEQARAPALGGEPTTWAAQVGEAKIRGAIGSAAKSQKLGKLKGWIKRVDLAEEAAEIVLRHLPEIPDTDLAMKIAALRGWIEK